MSEQYPFPFTEIVVRELEQVMLKQDEKGMKKYGQALDPYDEKYDWLQMAEEELADMVKYFKAEQYKRDYVIRTVMKHIEHVQNHAETTRDNYTVNAMEDIKKILGLIIPSSNK